MTTLRPSTAFMFPSREPCGGVYAATQPRPRYFSHDFCRASGHIFELARPGSSTASRLTKKKGAGQSDDCPAPSFQYSETSANLSDDFDAHRPRRAADSLGRSLN